MGVVGSVFKFLNKYIPQGNLLKYDNTGIEMCGGLEAYESFEILEREVNINNLTSKIMKGFIGDDPFIVFRYTMENPETMYFDGLYFEVLYFDGQWKFKGDNQISMGYSVDEGFAYITARIFELRRGNCVTKYDDPNLKIKLL